MSDITLIGEGFRSRVTLIKMYSDGTPMVKTDDWDLWLGAHTIEVRGGNLQSFTTAMFLVDALRKQMARITTLVLPYIPGARQDRTNPEGDVLFTLSSVATMINSRHFDRVVVLDPHSEKSNFFIDNLIEYPLHKVAEQFKGKGYDGVIVPDKGAAKRAEIFAGTMGVNIYYGGKTRDVSTGRLSGFTLEPMPIGYYLVVDDICDGGGTFVGLADKISEQGSTADLYVSHGIFAKGTRSLLKAYNHIYTTDSLAGSERGQKVTVLAVVEEMENYNE